MKIFEIAVLPGDGIGPEVMTEALKVLQVMAQKYNFSYNPQFGHIGGIAIDRFNEPLPIKTLEICQQADAVLLGSIGGPKWDHLPPQKRPELGGLLALRKSLNLFANIRPVKVFESLKEHSPLSLNRIKGNIDLLTVRELAGGIYFSEPKKLEDDFGLDTMLYKKGEIERIAKVAFDIAEKRRKKVISVDKANVLYSSMLWREEVTRLASDYPELTLEHMYVDNAAMQMILNPAQFDVILTTNLFGDILTDESAALCGSLGMLPSASLGQNINLYEPAGGSAPDIANKGLANPIAQILSAALMLDYSFGLPQACKDIYRAVENVLQKGYRTADIASGEEQTAISTAEMGDIICENL